MTYIYKGRLGKTAVNYCFRYPETSLYFHHFLKPSQSETYDVIVNDSDYRWANENWNMNPNGNLEYCLCMYRTSDYLTKHDSCLFHGAAFLLNNKAYLISADSGVGKTTQIRNWMELYSHEIRVMNGDKPILFLESDNHITVYPSPWKGKEEWGDDSIIAPLGGIILLKQGKFNKIERVRPIHYSARLLSYFFSTFEEENTVRKLCEIESAIWNTVPVWQLTNTGDTASAQITYQAIMEAQNEI